MKQIVFVLVLFLSGVAKGQDPNFSQYFSNPIYLNPAFAGYDACPTFRSIYRNQWPNISGNFQTANVSYDQQLGNLHGVGIIYQYDNAANTLESHSLNVVYAPVFRLLDSAITISPAVEFGWTYRRLNTQNLTFGTMIDPRYGFVYPTNGEFINNERHIFDMSTGLLITWKGLVAGFAAHHITQPDEGFAGVSRLPVRLTGHINYQFTITDNVKLSPAFIYTNQDVFNSFLPSISAEIYQARAGVAYITSLTNPDAVVLMFGYQGNGFKVGYSYDFTVSSQTNNTGGSHEASIAYTFKCGKKALRKGVNLINF